MWKTYQVELQFTTSFASSTPKNTKDIEAMLGARMPNKPPEDAIPLDELAEQIKEEVEATEEVERGYATFKRDDDGLYYEARCVRGHIKDCANILQKLLAIKALKSKVANRVYVQPAKIRMIREGKVIQTPDGTFDTEVTPVGMPWLHTVPLGQINEPDGTETRIVHAMTPKGPRSSLKAIDYVNFPLLKFRLKLLDDGVIGEDILLAIFEYGGEHGMGQERSQDWGKYELVKLEETQ